PRRGILGHTGFVPEEAGIPDAVEAVMTPMEERASVDRTAASGSIGLVLVVAVALVAVALFLLFVGRENAEPYVPAVLAALAVAGVFALFGAAAGIVELSGRKGRNDLTQALADGA